MKLSETLVLPNGGGTITELNFVTPRGRHMVALGDALVLIGDLEKRGENVVPTGAEFGAMCRFVGVLSGIGEEAAQELSLRDLMAGVREAGAKMGEAMGSGETEASGDPR